MFTRFAVLFGSVLAILSWFTEANAQGVFVPGAGAVSRSFGGATTAAPLDAASALYWNPAAISGLPYNEIMFAAEFAYAESHVSGTVPAGAFGGEFPSTTRSGETRGDNGLATLPIIALVFRPEESPWTFGLGILANVGGAVNYAGSPTNPVLTPHNPPGGGGTPPFTLGFGPQMSSLAVFTTAPTVSLQVTDQLAIGASALVSSALFSLDPAFFATPNANGMFPDATHGRPFWGAGFRAGLFYSPHCDWDIGLSYTSQTWFETFEFNSSDETGAARQLRLPFTLPQIISLGAAYKGFERTILAVDVRYFDYTDAKTLGDSVVDGGVGWDSIWAVALGTQYELTESTSVRVGYSFNENPIPSTLTLFNTQLPGFAQHVLGLGATMRVTECLSTSLAYVHTFENSISGPIAQITGADVGTDFQMDSLIFNVNVNF